MGGGVGWVAFFLASHLGGGVGGIEMLDFAMARSARVDGGVKMLRRTIIMLVYRMLVH